MFSVAAPAPFLDNGGGGRCIHTSAESSILSETWAGNLLPCYVRLVGIHTRARMHAPPFFVATLFLAKKVTPPFPPGYSSLSRTLNLSIHDKNGASALKHDSAHAPKEPLLSAMAHTITYVTQH